MYVCLVGQTGNQLRFQLCLTGLFSQSKEVSTLILILCTVLLSMSTLKLKGIHCPFKIRRLGVARRSFRWSRAVTIRSGWTLFSHGSVPGMNTFGWSFTFVRTCSPNYSDISLKLRNMRHVFPDTRGWHMTSPVACLWLITRFCPGMTLSLIWIFITHIYGLPRWSGTPRG